MKKLYIIAFFTLMVLNASAQERVLLDENFNWVPWTGTGTPDNYQVWQTDGEARIDVWASSAASNKHGWTSKSNKVWTRPGFLKLGGWDDGGDLCSPKLSISGEPAKITLTFQAVRYFHGTVEAAGILHVAVLNAGTIQGQTESYSVGGYDIKSAAKITLQTAGINGTSSDWKQEHTKYTITITGATADTQILFLNGDYGNHPGQGSRVCIDNVKVVTETTVDPSDFSTIILKKNGKKYAFKNSEVSDINFDYSACVEQESYEPETDEIGGRNIPESAAYSYDGAKISLADKDNRFAYDITATNCVGGQSSAAYGDYLFVVEDKLAKIHMYDLKNNKMLATCNLTPHNETTDAEGKYVLYHCNQSTFGKEKYGDSDFPLLYISQRSDDKTNADHKNQCFVNVFKIDAVKTDGKITSFTVTEVQKIYFPTATSTNALSNVNLTIDPETGDFYTYSRWNETDEKQYVCKISKFDKVAYPETTNEVQIVTLTDADDSYWLSPIDGESGIVSAVNMQGAFIWNKKLYISQGIPKPIERIKESDLFLRVVDLEKKELVNDIDLDAKGFTQEPEGLFMHDGKMKMSTNGKHIFTFYFQ